MGEHEDTLGASLLIVYLGKGSEGQDDDSDKGPEAEAHSLGCLVGVEGHLPALSCGCHNQVAVNAHYSEEVDAGEGVVLVCGDDELALSKGAKGPLQEQAVSNVDGQHQGKELISNGQVEDEDVG